MGLYRGLYEFKMTNNGKQVNLDADGNETDDPATNDDPVADTNNANDDNTTAGDNNTETPESDNATGDENLDNDAEEDPVGDTNNADTTEEDNPEATDDSNPVQDTDDNNADDMELSDADVEGGDDTTQGDNTGADDNATGDENLDNDAEEDPVGDTNNADAGGDDASTDTTDDTSGDMSTDEPSQLQTDEKEVFKDLTPEQLEIKNKELKERYIELYNSVLSIYDRVNLISKNSKTLALIDFILDQLDKLKEMVPYYLNNTYDTKSYIQNSINYQEYLVMMSTVNKLLQEIIKKTTDSNKK